MRDHHELVVERQEPLRQRYRTAPEEAWIEDRGEATGGVAGDPFHGLVAAGQNSGEGWRIGIHRAVGGFHDLPNPGDLLCTALAACFDTTLRIVAARLRVPLDHVRVVVRGEVDVRGTLAVAPEVPVGFQRLRCEVEVTGAEGVSEAALERLLRASERACVVLQTLRRGVPVELRAEEPNDAAAALAGRAGEGAAS
jgi:uncharacterized OsmC-like protein